MSALSDLRVIDLSTDVAGPFCAKLFADFGADVIKVEPPQTGDEARLFRHQSLERRPNPAESSGLFIYLNTNKRGVTLDLDSQQGAFLLRQLISTANVVVESFPPGEMEDMGLGFESLQQASPGIILVSVTPFGQDGPWSGYQATDIVEFAASGLSSVNGLASREPLKVPGRQRTWNGGSTGPSGGESLLYIRNGTAIRGKRKHR